MGSGWILREMRGIANRMAEDVLRQDRKTTERPQAGMIREPSQQFRGRGKREMNMGNGKTGKGREILCIESAHLDRIHSLGQDVR